MASKLIILASNLIKTVAEYKSDPSILTRENQKSLFDQNDTKSFDNIDVITKLTELKTHIVTEHEKLQEQCSNLRRGTPVLKTCQDKIALLEDHYHYYTQLLNAIQNRERFGGGNKRKTSKGRRKQNKSRRNRKSRR